ncbi:MAG: hypothetical protein PHS38_12190 [Bacteroidales bacterium]|nr:hypothetical protein [Bacteroidales bacterium]
MELVYTSDPIYIDIENFGNIQTAVLDDIVFTETYQPDPNYHGKYRLILKKDVTKDELHNVADRIREKVVLISKLIVYAIGHPIVSTNDQYGSRRHVVDVSKHKGWSSNFSVLNEHTFTQKDGKKVVIEINFMGMCVHSSSSESPFEEIVLLYNNYSSLSELEKALIDLHTSALEHEFDVKYAILGKALEIARELYPVNKKTKWNNNLPASLQFEFKQRDKNLDWLFDMSNNRYESRHVILKSPLSLHPRMSDDEYKDFMVLSDLLIIIIIRMKCGLPV